MGASTGDMLVDDQDALDQIVEHAPVIVVTHCEDSPMIWANEARAKEKYGDDVPLTEQGQRGIWVPLAAVIARALDEFENHRKRLSRPRAIQTPQSRSKCKP